MGPDPVRGRWAQTGTQAVPSDRQEKLLCFGGDRALAQALPRETVESPSLETFRTCLDAMRCNLLWVKLP